MDTKACGGLALAWLGQVSKFFKIDFSSDTP